MPVIQRRIRPYQQPLHSFMIKGGKRAIEIAHRRWGKDEIALAVSCELLHKRVGSVWHCLPEYGQARKALWTSVNAHTGKRRIDEAFPPEVRESMNDQEMFIRFKNGSTWQMIGSDRYNATVGAGVMGITYSEWALANPSAWAYHRPMLEENNGWAMFITTPRGNNHAKAMYDHAQRHPDTWFSEVSSVTETHALTQEQLDESLAEYISLYGEDMGRAQFDQEYLCSFNAAIMGSYWGGEINRAEAVGRFKFVPIDKSKPVNTAWDLGKAVNNPIWCFQVIDGKPLIVDFYLPKSDDLDEWCDWLNEREYNGIDYVPDDILDPIWGAKHTRWDLLKAKKRKPSLIKRIAVADGIHAGRELIKVATFHRSMMEGDERTERMDHGVEGLKNYRREWDDDRKTFLENPFKDWAEHIGSSWRYLGLAWREIKQAVPKPAVPKHINYEAQPDGSILTQLSANDMIRINAKKRMGGKK